MSFWYPYLYHFEMSTFHDRDRNAVLVIDVQNEVVEGAFSRDQVIANINSLIQRARKSSVPVIWVQHSDEGLKVDSQGWQIVPELTPLEEEKIIQKTFRSSFDGTALEETLSKLGVSKLFICGAQSNNCIRHTSHSALDRGYDIVLVSDAHTTSDYEWNGHAIKAKDVIDEQNDNLSNLSLPGRLGLAIESSSITF